MEPAIVISEARAKIIWGEPSSSVRNYLIANGISEINADAKIKEFNAERNSEIRKSGIKKTIIGAVLTTGAVIFFCWSLLHVDIDKMSYQDVKGFVPIAIVIALGGFYGLWKLIDGIAYLVRPQSEKQSVSEIS